MFVIKTNKFMPDSFFFPHSSQSELKSPEALSRAVAFIEIVGFDHLIVEEEEFDKVNTFFKELSQEFYYLRMDNYNRGLRVIEPEISITGDRIQLTSSVFLERNLPELSSFSIKLFVEFCNATMAVALRNDIPLKGMASIGDNYRGLSYSGEPGRSSTEDTMVLTDLMEVFSFEEIFPEGFGARIIPPVSIPYFFGKNLSQSLKQLKQLKEAGIFFPGDIIDIEAAEISIYSDILLETTIDGVKYYECNWKGWMEKNPDHYDLEEILADLECLSRSQSPNALLWKKFVKRIPV
jgi:hypothetical protein